MCTQAGRQAGASSRPRAHTQSHNKFGLTFKMEEGAGSEMALLVKVPATNIVKNCSQGLGI